MKFQPRRFIVNFVDGTAEFHDNNCPPAEEYLSLDEHNSIVFELNHKLDSILELVNIQAEDSGLWSFPEGRLELISEAHLKQELRKLHMLCES